MENRVKDLVTELELRVGDAPLALFRTVGVVKDHTQGIHARIISVNPISRRLHPTLTAEYLVTLVQNQMTITPYRLGETVTVLSKTFVVESPEQAQREVCQFVFGEYFCPF